MFSKRSKITDILLIILLIVISVLLILSGYFHFSVKKRVFEDSYFINQLGLIRGDIQRYTKLKIAGLNPTQIYNEIEFEINTAEFALKKEKDISNKFHLKMEKNLKKINKELKKLNTTKNKTEILFLSEKIWKLSNKIVNLALNYHKYKFDKVIDVFNYLIYATVLFLLFIFFYLYKKVKKGLEIETITDKLTKLYNRLYFNEIYNYFIEKYKRDKKPFSMLIIDIDNFKQINDKYGHATGDEVLKKIGEIIKDSIRKVDFPFRYGGEEFVIIFPETHIDEANQVAHRILENVSSKIKVNLNPVTISGGIGEYKGENPKEFFQKVDEALYVGKNTGKNIIIVI